MSDKRTSLAEQGLTALQVNWDAVTAVVLFMASFALYARTTAPGVLDGDFGEFQTNIYLLGVSHTGYPLYFLLAKLWTLILPVGSIALRANLFSGLFGALTLVMIFALLRTLRLSLIISLAISVLFGVSRVQWSQAVIPDVYTLNSFFIVLVLWLAILWRMGRVPLWGVGLAFGLSMTHHRTMIWIAPALTIFVLWGQGWSVFNPRELWKTIAALFLPLLLYAYIPLRGPSDVGVEFRAANFTDMILASNVTVWLRFGPPGFLWERFTQVYLALLIEQFTPVGFAFGVVGVAALALKRVPQHFPAVLPPRQLLLLLGLAHIGETAFAIPFWVVDSEIFFIPSYLTFLFPVAIGIAVVGDWVAARASSNQLARRALLRVGTIGLAALCVFLVWTNFPRNDQSRNDAVQQRWQEILAQPLETNATLMGPWEDLTPFEYYQYVENVRRDLKRRKIVLHNDQLTLVSQEQPVSQVRKILERDPVYLTQPPADIETFGTREGLDTVPFVTLWRMQSQHTTRGSATAQQFDAEQELQTLDVFGNPANAGDFVTLEIVWSSDAFLDGTRYILRLRDAQGKLWVEREMLPQGGRMGAATETMRDLQGFFVPPDAPPGAYTLELAAFDRESQTPRAILGEENFVKTPLNVRSAPNATAPARIEIPQPLSAPVGSAQFLGYGVTNPEPRGGDVLEFSSWWQNITNADDVLEIKFRDANDAETVLYQGKLFPNASGAFNAAQIVRARQDMTIPPQAAAGYGRLLLSWNGQTLPPIRIALGVSPRMFQAPSVPRPQPVLVGDSIQLLGYKLDRTQLRPGDMIPLTLYWNATKPPAASYKVFVHVVDAGGVLRAQRDSLPKNDALPTIRWFAGEYITDEYPLQLPSDFAPGNYRILVGMYDEASGVRLALTDPLTGRLPNDAAMLGDGIQIR